MTTTPQAVTERYVSNLISYGRNKEFSIITIHEFPVKVGEESCGFYYEAQVWCMTKPTQKAAGATISQAVRRALEKHGVTFR